MKHRHSDTPLVHHSDRGIQCCSQVYQAELAVHGANASMTDGYDCYQNALAERVNGILKQEFLIYRCQTYEDLKTLVGESIEVYNRLRPHLSLGMKTPEEVHKKNQLRDTAGFFKTRQRILGRDTIRRLVRKSRKKASSAVTLSPE